jgi:cysteinyl-tRNA synthetase
MRQKILSHLCVTFCKNLFIISCGFSLSVLHSCFCEDDMKLKFYNTETRSKEMFEPLNSLQVKMYTCGPTVYNFAHIGNFRAYVFEDVLRRTLKFFGYKVTQVMNLTDVDDKTIKGAIAKGMKLNDYTKIYKDAFFADIKTLNIEPVEFYPAATEYIDDMIAVIKDLLNKGLAYEGKDKSIYYSIHKFSRYGCLSHLNLSELQAGASERVASDEYEKEHAADFVLWKAYDKERDGDIYWESPFGPGRPGWHLECSVMAMKLLGPTIDLHAGGVDNIFPHHENEIAQSESYSGKQFVKYWMHTEHLIVDNKKMSKSLGNFFTLRDLLSKGWTGIQIRYMLMQTHYKTQLNFTFDGLEAAKTALHRLNEFVQRLLEIDQKQPGNALQPLFDKANKQFSEALADDLNISVALAALFDLMREVNSLCDLKKISSSEAQEVITCLKRFDSVLGVMSFEPRKEEIPNEIAEAIERRLQAKREKNWPLADELREFITSKGFVLEDTPQGSKVKAAK